MSATTGDEPFHEHRFRENWVGRTGLSFAIRESLHVSRSELQKIEVIDTDAFGRVLLLDGFVMTTEFDEFIYHEMITHPALSAHPDPRRVLVIGGGDGGVVREVLRHPGVESVTMVEIDRAVIDVSREFFPEIATGFDDPRLTLEITDGVRFVAEAAAGSYDVCIVDSTDPIGLAEGLFGDAFYGDVARITSPGGVLVAQSESPFDPWFSEMILAARLRLQKHFASLGLYLAHIPSYAFGMWSFTVASHEVEMLANANPELIEARLNAMTAAPRYYSRATHFGAHALPAFVTDLVAGPTGPP